VSLAVDAARQPADDDEPGGAKLAGEPPRDLRAVRGARARADDRDRGSRKRLVVERAADVQPLRRIVDCAKQRREARPLQNADVVVHLSSSRGER
jgi:hypothetical protein